MRNDMYQRGEIYASSDMHQVLKIKLEMIWIKGEKDMHQVLKENATFISFLDACLIC